MSSLLVLGASSDIGTALIEKVSDKYDLIYAHYNRMNEGLLRLGETLGNKLCLIKADFLDEGDTEAFADKLVKEEIIPSHIVHLPAPKFALHNFHKTQWREFQNSIDISLRSAVILLRRLLPLMAKRKSGKVVFMLTICTTNIPPKFIADYVTVKYSLMGLMKALAAEYESKGIRINAVSPDMVETKFLSEVPELAVAQSAAAKPSGKNLTVDEVLPSIEFLLSDNANGLSGQNMVVSY